MPAHGVRHTIFGLSRENCLVREFISASLSIEQSISSRRGIGGGSREIVASPFVSSARLRLARTQDTNGRKTHATGRIITGGFAKPTVDSSVRTVVSQPAGRFASGARIVARCARGKRLIFSCRYISFLSRTRAPYPRVADEIRRSARAHARWCLQAGVRTLIHTRNTLPFAPARTHLLRLSRSTLLITD